MSKQTAVQWLFQQIYGDTGHIGSYTTDGKDAFEAFEQAKEMERKQIEEAYNDGMTISNGYANSSDYYIQEYKGGEQ